MAKCQRTMMDMLFRSRGSMEMEVLSSPTSSSTATPPSKKLKADEEWKDAWYELFDWVEFNSELGRIFCKVCKERGGNMLMLMKAPQI
jgi:hypothetical protein